LLHQSHWHFRESQLNWTLVNDSGCFTGFTVQGKDAIYQAKTSEMSTEDDAISCIQVIDGTDSQ